MAVFGPSNRWFSALALAGLLALGACNGAKDSDKIKDYKADTETACKNIFNEMAEQANLTGASVTAMRNYCSCFVAEQSEDLSTEDWRKIADTMEEANRRSEAVDYEPNAVQREMAGMSEYGGEISAAKLAAMNEATERCNTRMQREMQGG